MQSDKGKTLQHDPGALLSDQGGMEPTSGDDKGPQDLDQGGFNQLYALILKQMQVQEREAHKQEQRWTSFQAKLNQVQDEMEAGRRSAARASMEPHGPKENGAASGLQAAGGRPPSDVDPLPPVGPATWSRVTIPKLEDGDDIEQYLTTFEHLATAYRWPRAEWVDQLVPYLTGKAKGAYVAMDVNESMDYDNFKEAILAKYEINEESEFPGARHPAGGALPSTQRSLQEMGETSTKDSGRSGRGPDPGAVSAHPVT